MTGSLQFTIIYLGRAHFLHSLDSSLSLSLSLYVSLFASLICVLKSLLVLFLSFKINRSLGAINIIILNKDNLQWSLQCFTIKRSPIFNCWARSAVTRLFSRFILHRIHPAAFSIRRSTCDFMWRIYDTRRIYRFSGNIHRWRKWERRGWHVCRIFVSFLRRAAKGACYLHRRWSNPKD